jgi:hypothetical protein
LGTWKSCHFDLVIDIAVVDLVNVDKFITRDTKAGYRKTVYFEPLVDVIGGIDNSTIKKSTNTFPTPPTIDSNSSMSIAVKKKLKFSPQSNNCTKKQAFLLNFCDRDEVKIECLKYVKHKADLPINQENQLTFLLNQFQVRDIQASFYKLIGEVGRVASSTFTPMSSQKKN